MEPNENGDGATKTTEAVETTQRRALIAALVRAVDGKSCQRDATGQDADCDEYAGANTRNWCWVCSARATLKEASA